MDLLISYHASAQRFDFLTVTHGNCHQYLAVPKATNKVQYPFLGREEVPTKDFAFAQCISNTCTDEMGFVIVRKFGNDCAVLHQSKLPRVNLNGICHDSDIALCA